MSSSTPTPTPSTSSSAPPPPQPPLAVAATATTSRKSSGEGSSEEGGQPPRKIHRIMFEPKKIVSVSSLDQMDGIIWNFQISKIRERIEQRSKEENELRLRIEQLEKRQTQDDAVLNVVNRYWNQLNEDVRIMLQRFDTETSDEIEKDNEHIVTTMFTEEMEKIDKEELDEKLSKKVQVSTRAVTKMIQAFDRLFQRSEKLCEVLKSEDEVELEVQPLEKLDERVKQEYIQLLEQNREVQLQNTSLHTKFRIMSLKIKGITERLMGEETEIDEMKNRLSDLEYEFEEFSTECKKKADLFLSWKIKVEEVEEQLGRASLPSDEDMLTSGELKSLQREQEELSELAEDRRLELDQLREQHNNTLAEIAKLNKELQNIPEHVVMETTEYKCLQSKFSVVYQESMMLRQLIEDVKKNLTAVNSAQQAQIKGMEQEEISVQKMLQTDMTALEDNLSQLKKEYEMLRVEFEKNAAANEQVAPVHREMRNVIAALQEENQKIKGEGQTFRQKCVQVQDENAKAKKYNVELIQKLEKLQQQRKLAERGGGGSSTSSSGVQKLEIKAEPQPGPSGINTAAPIPTPTSTSDPTGVKTEPKEVKVKKEKDDEEEKVGEPVIASTSCNEASAAADTSTSMEEDKKVLKEEVASTLVKQETAEGTIPVVKQELESPSVKTEVVAASSSSPSLSTPTTTPVAIAGPSGSILPPPRKLSEAEQAQIQDLKSQLKRCTSDTKEIKVLLDMHKRQSNKEQQERIEALVLERKAQLELDELKQELKRLQENQKKEEKKKVAEEDLSAKMKSLEERVTSLKRQLGAQKQEEEALLAEMDVTGQAFEDMQEQNSRLIQQLREKENANFKLMSDRIKANRVQELLKEEKEAQQRNNQILLEHLQHKTTVIRKLEEIEQQLVSTIAIMEKEAMVRQQAMELNKRKAIESAQSAADLKLHLEKYHSQMKEAQQLVAEKTSALASEAAKSKRHELELSRFTAKLERLKKIELAGSCDEVLMSEIQEYKETLTCPSCKIRRKDAVLTKCFHVFCFECLRTRYETRQRKCPRCNAAFGANDYHRLYLS